jgi:hypothetical protein
VTLPTTSRSERANTHAVVVNVTINDRAAAEKRAARSARALGLADSRIRNRILTIKDNTGLTMIMFESEDAANQMSEQVRSAVAGAVTLENVEVREVAAHA